MFALFVELNTLPDQADTMKSVLAYLTSVAATEPGTISYTVHQSQEAPTQFMLYELYREKADWQTHCDDPRIRTGLDQFPALLASPARVIGCDPIALHGVAADV
jgi:quinol monooxygenase YgiN